MHLKVQRQRPNRMRIGDHRIERGVLERDVGRPAIHGVAHALEPVIQLQNLPESSWQIGRGLGDRDGTGLVDHRAHAGLAVQSV